MKRTVKSSPPDLKALPIKLKESIARGTTDIEVGRLTSHKQVIGEMEELFKEFESKCKRKNN